MMCVFTEEEEARIATDEQKNLPKTSLFFWQKYYDYLLERKLQIKSPENL